MVTSSHLFDKIANQCTPQKIASIRNKPSGNKPRWGGMVVGMGMMVAEGDRWVAAVLVWNEDDGRRGRPPCLVAEGSWTLRQRIITNDACRLGTLLRGCGGGGLVRHRKGPDAGGHPGRGILLIQVRRLKRFVVVGIFVDWSTAHEQFVLAVNLYYLHFGSDIFLIHS